MEERGQAEVSAAWPAGQGPTCVHPESPLPLEHLCQPRQGLVWTERELSGPQVVTPACGLLFSLVSAKPTWARGTRLLQGQCL